MGLSSKKTKTTSTATTTPTVPEWIQTPAQKFGTTLGKFQDTGPAPYTPGISNLQTQAFTGAGGLSTSPLIGQAGDMVKGVNYGPSHVGASFTPPTVGTDYSFDPGKVQGASLLDGLSNYYNPYKDQITNPVLSDYDVNSGKVRAAQAAEAAGTGAFRGSRYGIREAATEGELARGRASTEGGLLSNMFDTATSLSGQDATRRQSAAEGNAARALQAQTTAAGMKQAGETTNAGFADTGQARTLQAQTENAGLDQAANDQRLRGAGLLSDIGQAQGSEDRANVSTQGLLGGQQTALENQIKQYPLEYQKQLEGLFAGMDPGLFTGQTQTGTGTSTTSDPMGTISKAAQTAAILFSDRRLKRDVVRVGRRADGLGVYLYRYLWSPVVHMGVVAQEVLRVQPSAVLRHRSGYLMVDYGRLA